MKRSLPTRSLNRREFLGAVACAAAAPMIAPGRLFGADGEVAPSNRITLGVVGWGMMGPGNTHAFLGMKDCQVVAACDVDQQHLAQAVQTINRHYGNQDCAACSDYREMLERKDIDAVILSLPDHWHMLSGVDAARAGKHIYGEKPLARTIAEQQAIVKAVQKHKVVWQTGSWQRSKPEFHKAAELVAGGYIGEIQRIEIGLPAGHHDFAGTGGSMSPSEPPPHLDYNHWLGPAKWEPYIKGRVHMNWRWNYNTGGGQLLDWVGHHGDIAHWAMGWDDSGPLEIEGQGEFPPGDAVWNSATRYRIEMKYPGNIPVIMAGGHADIRGGTKWIGSEGWVWVDRGQFEASNESWRDDFRRLPEAMRKKRLHLSADHHRNFIDGIKTGQPTITPVEVAHHSAIPGHLGLIAMLVGRKIRWDPAREVIVEDKEASGLLTRVYREPWSMI